jgi:hypothetical protein
MNKGTYTNLIVAGAIKKLGGCAQPSAPDDARSVVRKLGANIDLRSILDAGGDTLDDDEDSRAPTKRERGAAAV